MGYAFRAQVPDIINKRDHVLVVRGAPVAAIDDFDDIEMESCDRESCRAGGRLHDAAGSRVDKELIEQVAYGGGKLAESERFAECVKPEQRSIGEHVTLLLQSMRAYLGVD